METLRDKMTTINHDRLGEITTRIFVCKCGEVFAPREILGILQTNRLEDCPYCNPDKFIDKEEE